jgi:AraC-like DNA-binding protein
MVYTVLDPEKPGDLIQKLRHEKVRTLSEEGKPIAEIVSVTGLSDSYIRKIRRKRD